MDGTSSLRGTATLTEDEPVAEEDGAREDSIPEKIAALSIFKTAGSLMVRESTEFCLAMHGRRGELGSSMAATQATVAPPRDPRAAMLLARGWDLDEAGGKPKGPLAGADVSVVRDALMEAAAEVEAADKHEVADLRWREKRRKAAFCAGDVPARAIDHKKAQGLAPTDDDLLASLRQRAHGREASTLPGPLSKFGDGDGSFFDSWLTNRQFVAGVESASGSGVLSHVSGDPFLKPRVQAPHLGGKQWSMSAVDLAVTRDFRMREKKAKAQRNWKALKFKGVEHHHAGGEASLANQAAAALNGGSSSMPSDIMARLGKKKPL